VSQVEIKTKDEIAVMREAGRIVSEILDELEKAVAPGVSTWELDQIAEGLIHKKGAKPAFKGISAFRRRCARRSTTRWCMGSPRRSASLLQGI